MSNQSNRRIITNRQLNFTLSPVDLHNPKEMPYSLPNYSIDGTWNQHQSIILDVILEKIFNAAYRDFDSIPKSWRSNQALRVVSGLIGGAINPKNLEYLRQAPLEAYKKYKGEEGLEDYRLTFTASSPAQSDETAFDEYLKRHSDYRDYKDGMDAEINKLYGDFPIRFEVPNLIRDYPIFDKYRRNLFEIVKKISETKFRMDYRVKYIEDPPEYNEKTKRYSRGKLTAIVYKMDDFQNIFDAVIEKDAFIVNFKSPLGKMIIHNMMVLDTDWIPEKAFELSKNAYFIYKKMILGKVAGKNKVKELRLWLNDIKESLDMHWGNDRGVHATIDKAFKEMLAKGLVKDYSWNKDRVFRQYVLKFDHPQKGVEKQQDKGNTVMTLPT